tara:strand:+ start:370 stop:684 length:315 start_codon:yes stop_codon:yes gene_type:complete
MTRTRDYFGVDSYQPVDSNGKFHVVLKGLKGPVKGKHVTVPIPVSSGFTNYTLLALIYTTAVNVGLRSDESRSFGPNIQDDIAEAFQRGMPLVEELIPDLPIYP